MLDVLVENIDGLIYCTLYDDYWTMIFASVGCKELTGYNREDLIFNQLISYEEITFEADRQMVRDKINHAVELGERFEIEYRIRRADGVVIWVSERGNPIFDEHGEVQAIEGIIQNITTRKHIEQSLREAEGRYRSIFENAIEGIFQSTRSGLYLMVNPALARMYGYSSPQELMGVLNNINEQLYVDKARRAEFVQAIENSHNVQNFESLVYKKDGSTIWISENARAVTDEAGNLLYYEGTVEDITSRKSYEVQLEYQATHDTLTGLPNRCMLNDRLLQCINFATRYKNKMAVAFLDLDQFKLINDSMGHEVGDQLLLIMSQRLSACVREVDTVVRIGGDEFVILISNIDSIHDIMSSMKRILESVSEPCEIHGLNYLVTCSIGISLYPDDGADPTVLLKNADSAMYEAKKAGRNNYQVYTQALNEALAERVMLEYKLRQALENEEFILHYQPKVDFSTGLICGAEALIRWQPQGEAIIEPMRFIEIAEETGLIEKIGEWVLLNACKKAKLLKDKTGTSIPIAVNVSARQFKQARLPHIVKNILAETGLPAECLELEITESTLIDDAPKFIDTLHVLKTLGVKLAIDDFGTGYSNLAYLKDFPIDRLKIDKAFVMNLENDPTNLAILKAVVVLAHSLDKKVVAEGVETQYQHDFLKSIVCDEMQGHFFSRPLPEHEFETLIFKQFQS
ncbi:MAG: GGDEF domain-containing protein [Methylotenera sp. 24-45-7]|nr:MAG: GGDEF domain-containing protein [Methylotenera sp. 24-45-7]OZA08736.1 MAG: GGDEF domain-containing protein [Methylotenera sp. 17-45-7]OZA53603.1 MAG: GGDEF domain-containing protein [Methylophilales bacterium 39-45-7]